MSVVFSIKQHDQTDIDYVKHTISTIKRDKRHDFLIATGWRFLGNSTNGRSFYANLDLIDSSETFTQAEAVRLTVWAMAALRKLVNYRIFGPSWWLRYKNPM